MPNTPETTHVAKLSTPFQTLVGPLLTRAARIPDGAQVLMGYRQQYCRPLRCPYPNPPQLARKVACGARIRSGRCSDAAGANPARDGDPQSGSSVDAETARLPGPALAPAVAAGGVVPVRRDPTPLAALLGYSLRRPVAVSARGRRALARGRRNNRGGPQGPPARGRTRRPTTGGTS